MSEDECGDCKPVGEMLDRLDVTLHVPADETWLPVSAIVLVKGVDADGKAGMRCGWSDGMDWIARRGMIEIALDQERTQPSWSELDDE